VRIISTEHGSGYDPKAPCTYGRAIWIIRYGRPLPLSWVWEALTLIPWENLFFVNKVDTWWWAIYMLHLWMFKIQNCKLNLFLFAFVIFSTMNFQVQPNPKDSRISYYNRLFNNSYFFAIFWKFQFGMFYIWNVEWPWSKHESKMKRT